MTFWESFTEFLSFTDPGIRLVTLGAVLLTASSAIVGTFTFLKKKALVGDAVAHAVLPGTCLSFILTGNKDPLWLIIGAFITGWISLTVIDLIRRYSKLKEDTAIGLILSVFFGFGILLLTMIQSSGNASQSGLNSFIFGQAASLVGNDLIIFSIVSLLLIITVVIFYKSLALIAFDIGFARSIGFPVGLIEFILTTLTVMAVVVGIQAVGVVLMAAILITPPAAARFWTNKLSKMVILSAFFGALSGFIGAYISYTAPSMPTGPWVVVIVSIIAIVSFFVAPQRGIISRMLRQRHARRKMLDENILKSFYHLYDEDQEALNAFSYENIQQHRDFPFGALSRALRRLSRQGFLDRVNGTWKLSDAGITKSRRVVRLHRLWELFLTEYMQIAPDHVHDDAEAIEHIITPEIEEQLAEKLDYPTLDPHHSKIPGP